MTLRVKIFDRKFELVGNGFLKISRGAYADFYDWKN